MEYLLGKIKNKIFGEIDEDKESSIEEPWVSQ